MRADALLVHDERCGTREAIRAREAISCPRDRSPRSLLEGRCPTQARLRDKGCGTREATEVLAVCLALNLRGADTLGKPPRLARALTARQKPATVYSGLSAELTSNELKRCPDRKASPHGPSKAGDRRACQRAAPALQGQALEGRAQSCRRLVETLQGQARATS